MRTLSGPAEGPGAEQPPAIVFVTCRRMLMREIGYVVREFLTVPQRFAAGTLSGSLTVHAIRTRSVLGDLALRPSTISRALLGASLFSATVPIEAESPVIGRVDPEGRMFAAGPSTRSAEPRCRRALISDGSAGPPRRPACRCGPARLRPGAGRPLVGRITGGPSPGAGGSRRCQPAGSRPGKRRRHRPDPATLWSVELIRRPWRCWSCQAELAVATLLDGRLARRRRQPDLDRPAGRLPGDVVESLPGPVPRNSSSQWIATNGQDA